MDAALWRNVSRAPWFLARRLRDAGLEPEWAGTANTVRARRGEPTVRIAGLPGELLLYLFGRQRAAQVEVSGPADASKPSGVRGSACNGATPGPGRSSPLSVGTPPDTQRVGVDHHRIDGHDVSYASGLAHRGHHRHTEQPPAGRVIRQRQVLDSVAGRQRQLHAFPVAGDVAPARLRRSQPSPAWSGPCAGGQHRGAHQRTCHRPAH